MDTLTDARIQYLFDPAEAARQLEIVTGVEGGGVIDFRSIAEKGTELAAKYKAAQAAGDKTAEAKYGPRSRRGTLEECAPWLQHMNESGRAIYFMLNATDGGGATKAHVTGGRCIGLDLDETPLPDAFDIPPHVIVNTSEGKHQCVWRIEHTDDFDLLKNVTKRLAIRYGGDQKVTPRTQIFRLAGFYHQKFGTLYRSRIVAYAPDAPVTTVAEMDLDLPLLPLEGEDERRLEPVGDYDTPANIGRAVEYLENAELEIGSNGEPKIFVHMCKLRDFAISEEKRVELVREHLSPTCSDDQLQTKSANADKYATGRAGNATAANDFDDEVPTVPEEIDDWLEGKPEAIEYDEIKLSDMLDRVEDAMLTAGLPIYQTGGRLVHPVRVDCDSGDKEDVRRKAGAVTVVELSPLRLREYLAGAVALHKTTVLPSGIATRTRIPVPVKIANHQLARADKWRAPVLRGIIESPTLRSDGTLLAVEGYDEASGLLVNLGGVEYPAIPNDPTKADALAALEILCWPFVAFPFVDGPSRSVLLSAVLTALVRRVLSSAPMHGFSAPTMGTGKTLACDVVSMIATGRPVTAISQGANEEEDEKRLFSVLLAGDSMVLVDNVKRPIEGDALCTVLTQPTWQSRILGESRKVGVQTNALFMASGNNLTFKGDMTTRALLCRMDARVERPETRSFDVDLKVEVPKRRAALVMAGLTILRAFVVAGRPSRLEQFGRFEDWSALVRGALVWLGESDPCETRADIAEDDPERTDLEQLLKAITDKTNGWFTAGELIDLADEARYATDAPDTRLADAIEGAVPRGTAKLLGYYLKAKQGRIVGGLALRSKYDKHQKVWWYRVTKG